MVLFPTPDAGTGNLGCIDHGIQLQVAVADVVYMVNDIGLCGCRLEDDVGALDQRILRFEELLQKSIQDLGSIQQGLSPQDIDSLVDRWVRIL